jgi:hypothetical protein
VAAFHHPGKQERGAAPEPAGAPVWTNQSLQTNRALPAPGRRWPVVVRLRVRIRRFSLDGQLARGADPCSSLALACRAQQLCQPTLGRELAGEVEWVVEEARRPGYWRIASLNQPSITECRPLLLGVAQDLRCTGPVYARGVALVRLLLRDGRSPIYSLSEPRRLEGEVRRAAAALYLG